MMNEIWKPVPGFEKYYRVSNLGRVMSLHHGKEFLLKPKVFKGGQAVILMAHGKKAGFLVQRLVLLVFRPIKGARHYSASFRDGNSQNCRLDNLEWVRRAGDGSGRHKLNEAQAREIKALYFTQGMTQVAIAAQFGVSPCTVNAIIVGRSWAHVE